MPGALKEVRSRIDSVKNTQQITRAMKMVSAAKLRRAQDAIHQMRPYAEKLQSMLSNIVSSAEGDINTSLADNRSVERVLLITITSDRGLCGAYNHGLIKLTKEVIAEKFAEQDRQGNVFVLPMGKKGYEHFSKHGFKVIKDYWNIFSKLSFENVSQVSRYCRQAFEDGQYDKVEIIYSEFVNPAIQRFREEEFLPVPKTEREKGESRADFIFEPDKETLIKELMPKILNTQLFKAVLDGQASEHGARMTAMDKATDNADELLKDLKISYNRARQAAITTELTEIVSGAAALQG